VQLLRYCVLALIATLSLSIVLALNGFEAVPDAITETTDAHLSSGWFDSLWESAPLVLLAAGGALVIAHVTALVGVLKFRRWARTLFLGTFVASFILLPGLGYSVTGPWTTAVDATMTAFGGAVAALLLSAPVRERFLDR
jgi:hypothetical protein